MSFYFFFLAEDGIRYYLVTGVQTCALPISRRPRDRAPARRPVRAVPVRRDADGRGSLPGVRSGYRRRGEHGTRRGRDAGARARRASGARHGDARRDEHVRRAARDRTCGAGRRRAARGRGCAPAGAATCHGHRARRAPRGSSDHGRARTRAGGARLLRRHAAAAGRDVAGCRGGRRRDRGRDRGDAPRGGPRGEPGLVRRRNRGRHGAGVAAVTSAPRPPLGRSLLRLFTVQGSWNYERLQGIGVGVAEEPLLRDLQAAGNGAAYRAAVARGAHFFNAHPYLCGLAVGAAARAEHEGATPNQVERLRSALCGPLGSLGDRLVWAGWLPVTSGLALIGVALGLGMDAVLGFLIVYNVG